MARNSLLLVLVAALILPAAADYCCWESETDNACASCKVGAALNHSNWCGQSAEQCNSCNRTWCTAGTMPTHEGGEPIIGGAATQNARKGWLGVWRGLYESADDVIPEIDDSDLPKALQGVRPLVVVSEGGAAGGVVTEGMGYALLVEGAAAAQGDQTALKNGLGLMRAWLGMVAGPSHGEQPRGGGSGTAESATEVGTWPYGVSAIESKKGGAASGVATWKYPLKMCGKAGCEGSATDGDQDGIQGMIYLAAALEYPEDFVDVVMRAVIAYASADVGFPDLYRSLPDGTKVFVPKGGSDWGGLLPGGGKYKTTGHTWCYSPGYFGPSAYRMMRDFAKRNWSPRFDSYLPKRQSGAATSVGDLTEAFDGAVTAGYNILYRSSCASGSTSNWVGVKAECSSDDELNCAGVPWAHTPYVGDKNGTCTASGTQFGAYGAEASRTPWRIAMDYLLFPEEASEVPIYDTSGKLESGTIFNAQTFLNRIANQYWTESQCNGGNPGECVSSPGQSPFKMASAYDMLHGAPNIVCSGVPNKANVTWWGALLAYPTFTAFVAPFKPLAPAVMANWMDTFANICDFSSGKPKGQICDPTYFGTGQEVISTMIMAGGLKPPKRPEVATVSATRVLEDFSLGAKLRLHLSGSPLPVVLSVALAVAAVTAAALKVRRRVSRASVITLDEGDDLRPLRTDVEALPSA